MKTLFSDQAFLPIMLILFIATMFTEGEVAFVISVGTLIYITIGTVYRLTMAYKSTKKNK